jgi:hypothetical protein
VGLWGLRGLRLSGLGLRGLRLSGLGLRGLGLRGLGLKGLSRGHDVRPVGEYGHR